MRGRPLRLHEGGGQQKRQWRPQKQTAASPHPIPTCHPGYRLLRVPDGGRGWLPAAPTKPCCADGRPAVPPEAKQQLHTPRPPLERRRRPGISPTSLTALPAQKICEHFLLESKGFISRSVESLSSALNSQPVFAKPILASSPSPKVLMRPFFRPVGEEDDPRDESFPLSRALCLWRRGELRDDFGVDASLWTVARCTGSLPSSAALIMAKNSWKSIMPSPLESTFMKISNNLSCCPATCIVFITSSSPKTLANSFLSMAPEPSRSNFLKADQTTCSWW
mmetsp:Transcript_30043/g.75903  ORF Transcript_30043/g.75903 Transcript_30043/m.75903 type:complete len:279 (-) Transcript_30043:970-1806(-)